MIDELPLLDPCSSSTHTQRPMIFTNMNTIKADASNIYEYSPEELVDKALKALQDSGIQPIEWLSLLHKRMGVPVLIKDFHYLVPDEDLELASKLLDEDQGLPQSRPPPFLVKTGGDFYREARMYRVTRYTTLAQAQHLVLYPASLASFSPDDLSPQSRVTSLLHPACRTVLVPSPPAVYASTFRMMKNYSRYDPARIWLESDLSQLVDYNLYGLECGYVDIDDDELCEQLEIDRRIEDAVRTVQRWRHHDLLRDKDGWIVDALMNVVSGRWTVGDIPPRS